MNSQVSQATILEAAQNAQHGSDRPFVVRFYRDQKYAFKQEFATHALAWAAATNWEAKRGHKEAVIVEDKQQ